ncbi:UNC93-like protein [Coccinella septempunctata]|uniref:UNC93-like protein n=1 Tax=Coccinella septempunctata TaxID=41139 RepID=UPI001D07D923|nr:UNC93-like protein [Coccinella septempunctata]
MGSLPNLHELGKESTCGAFKPTTALGHLCGGQGGYVLSEHERNKILHRHNKVGKTRSYGCEPNRIIVDDTTLEHMAGYSPISNRSVRQFHQIRRKDSLSSSIGATSVRRLLAVVRNGPSHRQRAHRTSEPSKHALIVNVVLLCVSHLTITATYLPYLALQSSLSVWSMPDHLVPLDINVGSLFLGLSHVLASLVCLVTLPVNQRFGGNIILAVSYLLLTVHFIINLHPVLYLMIPSSIIFGVALGLMVNAQVTCLMTIAIKLSNVYRMVDEDEEMKNIRYTCLIRRTARAFRGAHDFGLIFGSIASTLIISWTIGNTNLSTDVLTNTTELICLQTSFVNTTSNCTTTLIEQVSPTYDYTSFLDAIFDTVEGTRLCGSQSCPSKYPLNFNDSLPGQYYSVLPVGSTQALTGFYAFLSAAATALIVVGMDTLNLYAHQEGSDKPQLMASLRCVREIFRDARMKLLAPMMFFIGLEQAFIYSDFGKSYVVCTLGIHRLNLVYLAMGSLQSIAACTLSMLLRSIRRYYIVGVGFTFHSCLMLVLVLWKPIEDDPALFFVISAAWGVCNAIWEMLGFTLLTCQYATDRWEAAFAVTSFYRLLGIGVAFLFHGYLCNYVKVYGLTFFMLAAVVTFTYLDIRLENIKKLKNISRL